MPEVVDVREYRALYRRTRAAGPEITKELRKRLRTAGKIGADAARLKIREWPVEGGVSAGAGGRAHRGLRATLASHIRVTAGGSNVLIRQGRGGLTGENAENLPKDIDRGGWYHPVYGRKSLYGRLRKTKHRHGPQTVIGGASAHLRGLVFQSGWPYFKREINSKRDEMVDEVGKVLRDITERLT